MTEMERKVEFLHLVGLLLILLWHKMAIGCPGCRQCTYLGLFTLPFRFVCSDWC